MDFHLIRAHCLRLVILALILLTSTGSSESVLTDSAEKGPERHTIQSHSITKRESGDVFDKRFFIDEGRKRTRNQLYNFFNSVGIRSPSKHIHRFVGKRTAERNEVPVHVLSPAFAMGPIFGKEFARYVRKIPRLSLAFVGKRRIKPFKFYPKRLTSKLISREFPAYEHKFIGKRGFSLDEGNEVLDDDDSNDNFDNFKWSDAETKTPRESEFQRLEDSTKAMVDENNLFDRYISNFLNDRSTSHSISKRDVSALDHDFRSIDGSKFDGNSDLDFFKNYISTLNEDAKEGDKNYDFLKTDEENMSHELEDMDDKRDPDFHAFEGKRMPAFHTYVGKRLPDFHFFVGKRIPKFHSYVGKRISNFHDYLGNPAPDFSAYERKRAPDFHFFVGKRIPKFHSFIGKRAPDFHTYVGKRFPRFHSFVGKRAPSFHTYVGKRAPDFQALDDTRIPDIHSFVGKTAPDFDSSVDKQDSDFNSIIEKRIPAFHSYVGKRAPAFHSYVGERAPAFHSYVGKRVPAFHYYVGKRFPKFHSYVGKRIPRFHSYVGKRIPRFHSFIGKRDPESPDSLLEKRATDSDLASAGGLGDLNVDALDMGGQMNNDNRFLSLLDDSNAYFASDVDHAADSASNPSTVVDEESLSAGSKSANEKLAKDILRDTMLSQEDAAVASESLPASSSNSDGTAAKT